MRLLFFALLFNWQKLTAQSDTLPWYHSTSIYQIYPRSYQDSNGDGIGDLKGIISRLDYIKELGFQTIWCSPFYASPQKDFGYDISDYYSIAPEYGTLEDAETLIKETHKRGMKIVFDMVMNHTSDQHSWFTESASSRTNPKADWYVWSDKPNNWKSVTGGSGWHYVASRNQYYWADFLPFQPDLNYRNPAVKQAMFDIVRFWLKKGADGFRLDMFDALDEDSLLRSNTPGHKRTLCDADDAQFAKELRAVCEEFGPRMLLGEVFGSHEHQKAFLGDKINNGLTLAFQFEMLRLRFSPNYFYKLMSKLNTDFPKPLTPVYTFSNHDRRRSLRRLKGNQEKMKLVEFIQLFARAVPCVYYGEEIGMQGVKLPYKTALDPMGQKFKGVPRFLFEMVNESLNRDEMRTPMQWNSSPQAGFSTSSKTWLPIEQDYQAVNAEKAMADSASLYHHFHALLSLRNKNKAISEGDMLMLPKKKLPHGVIGFTRSKENETITFIANFTNRVKKVKSITSATELFSINKADGISNGVLTIQPRSAVVIAN